MLKTTKPAHLRLVINNQSPVRSDSPPRPANGRLEIGSELFDMTDARIFDLAPSDLLDRSFGDSATRGHLTPAPLRGLKSRQNELIHRSHAPDNNPGSGFMQPSNGSGLSIRYTGMAGRPPKASLPTSKVGQIFAENVSALLSAVFPLEGHETGRIKALAKSTGVGKETIRHAIRGGRSPSLDAVASIAEGLDVTISDLLTKGFGAQRAEHLRTQASRQAPTTRQRRPGLTG